MSEGRKAELKISGMVCATCSNTIEKSLRNLKGVDKADINLATETGSVEYDPSQVRLADLEKAVRDSGYNVINEKSVIKVGGMVCSNCVLTIEDSLKKLDGVVEVRVNLASENAYVTYNPSLVSQEDMLEAIEDAGYQYLGLAGEEKVVDLERELRDRDLLDKRRRIVIGFAASILLMLMMYLPWDRFVSMDAFMSINMNYLMLIISAPVFVYLSFPIFTAGMRALRNRNLDMNVMYSLGIGVAYISSVFATFNIVLTSDYIFYDTAIMLATFLTLGRYLETRAKGRTSEAIKKLAGLQPKMATLLRERGESEVPIEEVQVDDRLVVKPGEKIPVDGLVLDGKSYVDESIITGEPVPVLKEKGLNVIGGTINKNGMLQIKATKVGKDSALAQIISLVEVAQGSRPPIQRIADKAVSYFIPIILIIAFGSFAYWYFIAKETLLFALTILISVLVVACPCALGLASPTAVTVGIGRGAELGILIKSGEALEASGKLMATAFDKTGTLTVGKPEVTDMVAFGIDKKELLRLAAGAEKHSEHPLAEAVLKKAEAEGISLADGGEFEAYPGKGVVATVDGKVVIVGNRMLFRHMALDLPEDALTNATSFEEQGKTVVLMAVETKLAGIFAVSDRLKDTAIAAVSEIKRMNMNVTMITGDNARSAAAIAAQLGIDDVHSEVLPEEKANEIKEIQKGGVVVAFVGDGINDAPALAQADVGIAIGSGTDVAVETGDIVLIRDDLLDVVAGIQLSRKVLSRIKQNIFWAFAYNIALVPIAAGILYPSLGIIFRPELAALAMALSSVTVISLSLRLKKYLPPAKHMIRNGG
ncbi:MAG: heavy metal translocating P-type ATPase [Methanotrichaceae archaeon]|nr:heavy metal translocating P-type ATPase [Methanotrichaceae archaeon]